MEQLTSETPDNRTAITDEELEQLYACPTYHAQLVGLLSRRAYPAPLTVFTDKDEGERWCHNENRALSKMYARWELVES